MSDEVQRFFDDFPRRAAAAGGLDNSYVFEIDGRSWTVEPSDGGVAVREGAGDAHCKIVTTGETFERMLRGEENPVTAYTAGTLRIRGDMAVAVKLQKFFT
jgi:putative sterol carrier protein